VQPLGKKILKALKGQHTLAMGVALRKLNNINYCAENTIEQSGK